MKYHTALRPGLRYLREHKFKHSFQDTLIHFVCLALMLYKYAFVCITTNICFFYSIYLFIPTRFLNISGTC